MQKLITEYKATMSKILSSKSDDYLATLLKTLNDRIISDLLRKFNSSTILDQNKDYEAVIMKSIDEIFQEHLNEYKEKEQETCIKYLSQSLDKIHSEMRKGNL